MMFKSDERDGPEVAARAFRIDAAALHASHEIVRGSAIGSKDGTALCTCGGRFDAETVVGWYQHQAEVILAAADRADAVQGIQRVQTGEETIERVAVTLYSGHQQPLGTWANIPTDLHDHYRTVAVMVLGSVVTSLGAQWNAIAVFGDSGTQAWGHVNRWTGRMALVDAGMKDLIQDHPPFSVVPIVAAPPPLK